MPDHESFSASTEYIEESSPEIPQENTEVTTEPEKPAKQINEKELERRGEGVLSISKAMAEDAPVIDDEPEQTAEEPEWVRKARQYDAKAAHIEELRAKAEAYDSNWHERSILADPDCPVDAIVTLMNRSAHRYYEGEYDDSTLDPMFPRLEAMVASSETSMDDIDYIAFSEELHQLGKNYKEVKKLQKTAQKVIKQSGIEPRHKIQIEVDERKKRKDAKFEEEIKAKSIERATKWAASDSSTSRSNAANEDYCPLDILIKLAIEDSDEYVRQCAARNKNQTPETLKKVTEKALSRKDYAVVQEVLLHQKCTPDLAIKTFGSLPKKWKVDYANVKWTTVKTIKKSTDALIDKIENHPDMPIESLRELKIQYRGAQSPLDSISRAAGKKLRFIRMQHFLGNKVPNPDHFPTEVESEEEMIKRKQGELEKRRQAELLKQQEREAMTVEMLAALKKAKELAKKIGVSDFDTSYSFVGRNRIAIPDTELFVNVDDHHEINPKYLPYLCFVDFSFANTKGLKVSGIDWSETNIHLNPQEVFDKDLSNAKFGDNAFVFTSLKGCNLSGSDISKESESYGFDQAITDEHTKLPPQKKPN